MHRISAVLDRFEKGQAVLVFDTGQTLTVSKRILPRKIKEGSVLYLEFYRGEDEEKRRQNIARYLLEEILHPHEKN